MTELQKLIAQYKIDEKKLKLANERIALLNCKTRIDEMQKEIAIHEKCLAEQEVIGDNF
mgnify:CR=1 FL=1